MTDKITNEDLAPILAQEDPRFRAFVERFDSKCWARYDLSALRISWHFARQEAERQAIERCATLCDEEAAYARLHGGAQNGALMAQMLADDIRALGGDDDPYREV